jgi:hypothetical protein
MNRSYLSQPVATVLLLLLAVYSVLNALDYGNKWAGMDFYQFWAVGQAVKSMDISNIYADPDRTRIATEMARRGAIDSNASRHHSVAERRPVLETYSSPLLYTFLGLFGFGTYETAFQIYRVFSLVCGLLAVAAFCRLLCYSTVETLAVIALLTGWFEPFFCELRVLNVNLLQLGFLAMLCWMLSNQCSEWREISIGFLMGFLVMFKLNTLFIGTTLFFWYAFQRLFGKVLRMAVGAFAAVLFCGAISAWFFGSVEPWVDWVGAVVSLPDEIITPRHGNYSLSIVVADLTGVDVSMFVLPLFFLLSVIFLWIICHGHTYNDDTPTPGAEHDVMIVGLGCLVYLIAARLVWLHYYLLSIPSILSLLRLYANSPRRESCRLNLRMLLLVVAVVLVSLNPLLTILKLRTDIPASVMCVAATLVLFSLTLYELWRWGRIRQSSERSGHHAHIAVY